MIERDAGCVMCDMMVGCCLFFQIKQILLKFCASECYHKFFLRSSDIAKIANRTVLSLHGDYSSLQKKGSIGAICGAI